MAMAPEKPSSPIRQTTAESIRLAKTLMRQARFGALAVLEPQSGHPFSSRVAVATTADGAPVILVSRLSGHTAGLLADPRCSILLGEPGKGDPLAHPRITIQAIARFLEAGTGVREAVAERYLRRNPKAKLYAGFADFSFVRLEPQWASLNGGFGQAYRLEASELLDNQDQARSISQVEASAIAHMEGDHNHVVQAIAAAHGKSTGKKWQLTGIDSTGLDLTCGDATLRVWFDAPLSDVRSLPSAISAIKSG